MLGGGYAWHGALPQTPRGRLLSEKSPPTPKNLIGRKRSFRWKYLLKNEQRLSFAKSVRKAFCVSPSYPFAKNAVFHRQKFLKFQETFFKKFLGGVWGGTPKASWFWGGPQTDSFFLFPHSTEKAIENQSFGESTIVFACGTERKGIGALYTYGILFTVAVFRIATPVGGLLEGLKG